MRLAVAGLLVATAFVLGGCQYLLGGTMGGPLVPPIVGSFDPGAFGSFEPGVLGSFDPNTFFSLPPPLTTFTKGTGSVAIAGKTTALDRLNGTASIYEDFGTEVGWTDGDGTYVRFFGEPESAYGDGFVTLDRITGGQHWTIADPSGCKVTITQNDAKGVVGTASCKGLRWVDALSTDGPTEPSYIAGEAPFDAEIAFQAAP